MAIGCRAISACPQQHTLRNLMSGGYPGPTGSSPTLGQAQGLIDIDRAWRSCYTQGAKGPCLSHSPPHTCPGTMNKSPGLWDFILSSVPSIPGQV